jgi:hypothetical protein
MTPAWILDIFAAVMLIVSAVSAGRLGLQWPWRHDALHPDVDIAHLLMGISMAGMLAAGLRTLPDTLWEVLFGVLTAWFTWQVIRDARAEGVRALAGGHCAPHMIHSAAMLYMYLAVVTPAAGTGSAMGGMGASGMQSLSYPTLAFVFGLALAGYSVWDLDRLSGKRYSLSRATTALAGPALAGVAATGPTAVLPASTAGLPGTAGTGAETDDAPSTSDTADGGQRAAGAARGLLLSPGTAVSCRVAMGITMALMLFLMI